MNTKLLADTIGSLDGELLDEVIEEHYKRTMPGKTIVIPRYRRAIAVAAILLTVSAAVPLIVINNKPGDIKIPENNGLYPTSIPDNHTKIYEHLTDREIYSPLRGGFTQIKIDKVYDGVYCDDPDDPGDVFRYIIVECTAIHDIFERIPDQMPMTIRIRLDMYAASDNSKMSENGTRGTDEDGIPYDTTQQKKREWQYDDAEKYKEFLLEHNEGYLFVPGWRTITQEVYSLDTNKFETVTLSLSDHFRLNEYCYLPLTENRIDLNAVCRFILSNKGYLDTVYGDIIKDGMTKNDFEEEFKALLSEAEQENNT